MNIELIMMYEISMYRIKKMHYFKLKILFVLFLYMYLKNINYMYNNFEALKHVSYDDEII